ncbi:MAG: L-seryl-tRNA(Sec) selenium transferase, partial [Anaerolineae bacterium]
MPARSARQLPAVGKVLTDPRVRALEERLGHTVTVRVVREAIDGLRGSLESPDPGPSVEAACASVLRVASRMLMPSLRRVINATGIIVHTNLGRAPLSPAAVAHLARVAQ